MWGRHLVLDCAACELRAVRDGGAIREFCADLVASIGMVAYGDPVVEHFATHLPEAAGYSLVQLIETSAVTGRFCDASGGHARLRRSPRPRIDLAKLERRNDYG